MSICLFLGFQDIMACHKKLNLFNQQTNKQLCSPSDLKKADPDFPPWAPHATECCSERMYLQGIDYTIAGLLWNSLVSRFYKSHKDQRT